MSLPFAAVNNTVQVVSNPSRIDGAMRSSDQEEPLLLARKRTRVRNETVDKIPQCSNMDPSIQNPIKLRVNTNSINNTSLCQTI